MKLNGKVNIDKNIVLKFLGYSNRKPPEIIFKKINEEIETLNDFIKPEVFIRQLRIEDRNNSKIILENGCILEGKYVSDKLKNCREVALALYTLGHEIESRIRHYSSNQEAIRAMILDKIGIVALDYIRDEIKSHINNKIIPLKVSCEIYPGQNDFNIQNQGLIFDLLRESNPSININESYQFDPIKTVGVILGIGMEDCSTDRCEECNNKCF